MPLWIRSSRPTQVPYVEVFVDLDELLRTNDVHRPFDRKTSVRAHLERVVELARELAERFHITLFEDLCAEEHGTLEELERAVKDVAIENLTLVHCRGLRKDEALVTLTLIKALHRAHDTLRGEIPLCLVASSRHYEPTVRRLTQQERIVYVGLPTLTRFPTTAKAATAACWLDTEACTYQALHARLAPAPATRAAAAQFLRRDFHRAQHTVVTNALEALLRDRPVTFASGPEFRTWIEGILGPTDTPPWLFPWLQTALWEYKLLLKEEEWIRWNEEHSALHPERDL